MSKKIYANSIRGMIEANNQRLAFQDWNYRKEYFELIQNSSINRVQHHFTNREPLFMMGIRRDVLASGSKTYGLEGLVRDTDGNRLENITQEDEDMVVDMIEDDMEYDIQELKDLLLFYGLGFIPLYGRYTASGNDEIKFGLEMSVLVPMSPNYKGYTGIKIEDKSIKERDFRELAFALKDDYIQDSIVIKNSYGQASLFYSPTNYNVVGNNVNAHDVEEYASMIMKGNANQKIWWELTKDLTHAVSSLYTISEKEILYG